MKKLLLIAFLFLITPYAKADMDYICETRYESMLDFIPANCERNNILMLTNLADYDIDVAIALWCRHDREININGGISKNGEKIFTLVCVLYDNYERKKIYSD
tara:strand:+ start:221 stop:529 length:309 start_codon:yes stop_codon:yes gene_type:complete